MHFLFHYSSSNDIDFYTECFSNEEFQYMLYGKEPLKISGLEKYIINDGKNIKFVASLKDSKGMITDIGFAHFYYKNDNAYTYVGGVHPKYFNQGYGIYASIAMLSLMYDLKPDVKISTGTYKHNRRSLRANIAIGFAITSEIDDKLILQLSKVSFDNDFVKYIKQKIKYELLRT